MARVYRGCSRNAIRDGIYVGKQKNRRVFNSRRKRYTDVNCRSACETDGNKG